MQLYGVKKNIFYQNLLEANFCEDNFNFSTWKIIICNNYKLICIVKYKKKFYSVITIIYFFRPTEAMVPMKEEVFTNSRMGSPSSIAWLYLLAEFFIGVLLSTTLFFLGIIKSLLPKPPRDLTGDIVLVGRNIYCQNYKFN